jgi:hypothetical protein
MCTSEVGFSLGPRDNSVGRGRSGVNVPEDMGAAASLLEAAG